MFSIWNEGTESSRRWAERRIPWKRARGNGRPFPSGLRGRIWDRCFACDGPCPGWAAGTFPTLNYAGRSWNCAKKVLSAARTGPGSWCGGSSKPLERAGSCWSASLSGWSSPRTKKSSSNSASPSWTKGWKVRHRKELRRPTRRKFPVEIAYSSRGAMSPASKSGPWPSWRRLWRGGGRDEK